MEVALSRILDTLPVAEYVGNTSKQVRRVIQLSFAGRDEGDISWVSDKNVAALNQVDKGIIICSTRVDRSLFKNTCTYLLVENPRLYFLKLVGTFFVEPSEASISERAVIHPTAKLGRNCSIAPGVVIEKNCVLGDEVEVGPNTVIKNTVIGNRVKIGANNTVGGVGFGYEKNEDGKYDLIPHIGNVVIEDNVEIGNNTAIDRAVLGSTLIRRNAKIDNLVHIAHGVTIGENSLIIANAMIAGSAQVGTNVWVSPSASVLNKLQVGNDSVIGMGAVVLKDVAPNQTIVGNPGKELKRG